MRENYQFADYGNGSSPSTRHSRGHANSSGVLRTIDLGAFGQEPLSTKTACFGVVSGQHSPEDLVIYRALGAPQLLTVSEQSVDRWMVIARGSPKWLESLPTDRLTEAIQERAAEWGPQSILRAKAIGSGPRAVQLDFFDFQLIPTIERVVRRKLSDLLVAAVKAAETSYTKAHAGQPPDYRLLFRLVFRLLAAKLLADREHRDEDWLAGTAAEVVRRVERFYYPENDAPPALDDADVQAEAWHFLSTGFHLQNVSLDTLAWIWEHTLVTEEVRRELSIHGTPPEIAEYVVRRLPFENVPLEQLRVFEPFMGKAVFLVSALSRIRELLLAERPYLRSEERHSYFVRMLAGLELDPFGLEVARLSLMLADYPHPAGWDLMEGNVFHDQRLGAELTRATAVLCNPPFEKISPDERVENAALGGSISRSLYILRRVLDSPPLLLGFVLPGSFRDGVRFRSVRRRLAETYGELEVTALPDRLYSHSEAESVLLLAHGHAQGQVKLRTSIVDGRGLDRFLSTGEAGSTDEGLTTPAEAEKALWRYPLKALWDYLESYPRFGSIGEAYRGIEYKLRMRPRKARAGRESLPGHRSELVSDTPREGFRRGVVNVAPAVEPFYIRKTEFMSMDPAYIRRKAHKRPWDRPKVLVNRHRTSRRFWSLVAVPDYGGLVAYENFHGVWPTGDVPVEVLAALLNGAVANAYVTSRHGRNNRESTIQDIPIPPLSDELIKKITDLVSRYRVERDELEWRANRRTTSLCGSLLRQIRDTVLEAYALPPALKQDLSRYIGDLTAQAAKRTSHAEELGQEQMPLFQDHAALLPSRDNIEADASLDRASKRLVKAIRELRPDLVGETGEVDYEAALKELGLLGDGNPLLTRAEVTSLGRRDKTKPVDAE